MNQALAGILGCALLIAVTCAAAQDWPQWRGPNRDGRTSGFTAPQVWPKELTQKWSVTVGAGDTTPALVGDRLYAFGRQDANEVISCLDAASGKRLWEDRYAANHVVTGPAARHPGPRSSPAVADGRVCTLGVGGILSCLDAATGKVVWRKQSTQDYLDTEYKFDSSMSPIVVDGLCIVYVGGKDKGAIIAFDVASGQARWKRDGEAPASSSPAVMTADGTKQIVTLSEKLVVGVSLADGKLLWQVPYQAKQGNNTTPVIDGQTMVITGQAMATLAIKVSKQDGQFVVKEIWRNGDVQLGPRFTTPVLKDRLLFGFASGKFYCLSAKTGEMLWTDTVNRGASGAIVDVGSCLMALTLNMELVAYEPSPKQYTEIARFKVANTETWAHPVIAGKRIYVRDQATVTLWTMD